MFLDDLEVAPFFRNIISDRGLPMGVAKAGSFFMFFLRMSMSVKVHGLNKNVGIWAFFDWTSWSTTPVMEISWDIESWDIEPTIFLRMSKNQGYPHMDNVMREMRI